MTAELILYATPTGPLADSLDVRYRRLEAEGPTTAQDYPPHCTLTGFFHRAEDDVPRIVAELEQAIADIGAAPENPVEIVSLHRKADWVGLELRSEWLRGLTQRFVEVHRVDAGDDALRPKDWLHLSIGYGVADLGPAREVTADFDLEQDVDWEVGLWERHLDATWSCHASLGCDHDE